MPAERKPARKGRRSGNVGAATFAQVEKLMAEEKIKRAEAFRRISAETGRTPQSVATNYYRIARTQGVALKGRRGGRKAARSGGGVARALADLAKLLRAQESELARLRAENTKFAALRKLLGK